MATILGLENQISKLTNKDEVRNQHIIAKLKRRLRALKAKEENK